jgi:hypothetical protein
MYNRGFSIFGNNPTEDDFYKIAMHVTHLHSDIFTQLNIAILNNLGWTKRHEDCTTLFPLAFDTTQHKPTCPYSNTAYKPPAHTTNYSGTHFWTPAFTICPPTHHHELNTMTNTAPNPEDPIQIILLQVWQWHQEGR